MADSRPQYAFPAIEQIETNAETGAPIMARTKQLNKVLAILEKIRFVNVTLPDTDGDEKTIQVLTLGDAPNLEGGSGGGAGRVFKVTLTDAGDFVDMTQVITDIAAFYTGATLTPASGDLLVCTGGSGTGSGRLHFIVYPRLDSLGVDLLDWSTSPKFTIASVDYVAVQIGPNWFY